MHFCEFNLSSTVPISFVDQKSCFYAANAPAKVFQYSFANGTMTGLLIPSSSPRPPRVQRSFHSFLQVLLFTFVLLTLCTADDYPPSHLASRDFKTLDDDAIQSLLQLDPPEWSSVTDGHLGKILIPRIGRSVVLNSNFPADRFMSLAGTANKLVDYPSSTTSANRPR